MSSHPNSARVQLGLAIAAAIAGTAASLPSWAQEASKAQEAPLAEIQITGSRIVRRDLEAASPILTVEPTTFENISNLGMEAALNKLPQFQPAGTQFVTSDNQASAFNSPGISSLNLRGLGSNRSLILVDGRRAQPANATLVVDVNTIPSAAIANVEVISGGASATYGADAIAGVVNFKLKKDFQGMDLDVQSGITEQGDGAETRLSVLIGSNLADGRGNVMFGAEASKRDAVQQRDRDFYTRAWADPGTLLTASLYHTAQFVPTGTNLPSQAAVNALFPGYTGVNRTTAFNINADGTVFKNIAVPGNPGMSSIGYTGSMAGVKSQPNGTLAQPETTTNLSSPLQRYSLFGRATFDVTDNTMVFIQANLSSLEVVSKSTLAPAVSVTFNTPIPRDAAHPVSPQLAALLDSRPNPNAPFNIDRTLDFLDPLRSENDSTMYQLMFGLDGKLPIKDWTWEAYVSHGETRILNYLDDGYASRERMRLVAAAPNYGANLTLTSPGSYTSHCTTGLPFVSYFTVSQDCKDAISVRMKNITSIKQDVVELDTQGGIVDLPSGELRGALGASYRKDQALFDPDVLNDTESVVDTPIGLFAANNTAGTTKVKEIYGELLVPILKDLPAIRDLNFELGARLSDYDFSGKTKTYKGLMNWKVNDFVSFRGGYQAANRAPNIAELYLGVTQTVAAFPESDPCAVTTLAKYGNVASNPNRAKVQQLCSAIIGTGISVFDQDPNNWIGGNGGYFPLEREARRGSTSLKPEEAKTWTAGFVLRSPFEKASLSRMTASIDYYRISINDTIAPLGASAVYALCFNADGNSNPTYSVNDPGGYCKLTSRDGVTGGRLQVEAPYANLGLTTTSGIDLQFNWQSDLADLGVERLPGAVAVSLGANYLFDFTTQTNPVAAPVQNKGTLSTTLGTVSQTGQYDYRTFTTLSYINSGLSVGLNWMHLPSIHNAAYAMDHTTPIQGAGSYDNFGMFAGWQVTGNITVRGGIDNLLNREPEVVGYTPGVTNALGSTASGFYDLLGRRYYAGAQVKF